ncbi:hypothetical protein JDV09_26245 [Mycobacterium sp. Y57]|uniref:hypothetical protein n=1 Tax=Mycolicibacterium xanthum TaxID=2796469 RepID=UPI001C853D9E|nr:hypothetical protein [Mycolicibacterium xanthum]MBX7435563.1 hypothetical protein [Mycolicibacterium xanthum]
MKRVVKRATSLKAGAVGVAMAGLVAMGAGAAAAYTASAPDRDGAGAVTYSTDVSASTDYGRGTTRSDNSPGSAGGLS